MVNVGSADRTLRFVRGTVLIVLPFIMPLSSFLARKGARKYAFESAGLLRLVTAIFCFCPAHSLAGIRACKLKMS
jgi:hypothetical protein